jgi:hypothetical protein
MCGLKDLKKNHFFFPLFRRSERTHEERGKKKKERKKPNPYIFRQIVLNPYIFALFATFYFFIPEKTSTSTQLKPNKHTR